MNSPLSKWRGGQGVRNNYRQTSLWTATTTELEFQLAVPKNSKANKRPICTTPIKPPPKQKCKD